MKVVGVIPTYEELYYISEFAQLNSYMEFYGFEQDPFSGICFNTRKNGNELTKVPSELDIQEANRLGELMLSELIESATFDVNTYDEWVSLEIKF
jgi:hypothetical protein